jgi:hypothetical protein
MRLRLQDVEDEKLLPKIKDKIVSSRRGGFE